MSADRSAQVLLYTTDERLEHLILAEVAQLGIAAQTVTALSSLADLDDSYSVQMILLDAMTSHLPDTLSTALPADIPLYVIDASDRDSEWLLSFPHIRRWQRPLSLSALQQELLWCVFGDTGVRPAFPEHRIAMDWNAERRVCRIGDHRVTLTAKEAALMNVLWQQRGHVVSKEALRAAISAVECGGEESGSNALEVYLCYLRRKLEKPTGMRLFATVRGQGYLLKTEIDAEAERKDKEQ